MPLFYYICSHNFFPFSGSKDFMGPGLTNVYNVPLLYMPNFIPNMGNAPENGCRIQSYHKALKCIECSSH